MKINKLFFSLIATSLLFFSACIKVPPYRHLLLKNRILKQPNNPIDQTILLQTKQLTNQEIEYLFGPNGKGLRKNTIIIAVFIDNNTAFDYVFSPQDITIKSLGYNNVTKFTKKRSSFSSRLGKIIFSLYTFSSLYSNMLQWRDEEACRQAGSAILFTTALTILSIPGTFTFITQGITSALRNRKVNKILKEQIIDRPININSGQLYEGLIFIKPSEYQSTFTLTIHQKNQLNEKIIFNVNLCTCSYPNATQHSPQKIIPKN